MTVSPSFGSFACRRWFFCWLRAGSFRHSSPGCEHDGLAFIDPFRPRLGQVRPVLFGCPKGFLKAEPAGNQELRKPGGIHLDVLGLHKRVRQLRHRDVAMGRNSRKDEVLVRSKLAMPEAAARAWFNTARLALELHQVHGKGNRRSEPGRRLMARVPALNNSNKTQAQNRHQPVETSREHRRLLQPARHLRAVDQRR